MGSLGGFIVLLDLCFLKSSLDLQPNREDSTEMSHRPCLQHTPSVPHRHVPTRRDVVTIDEPALTSLSPRARRRAPPGSSVLWVRSSV